MVVFCLPLFLMVCIVVWLDEAYDGKYGYGYEYGTLETWDLNISLEIQDLGLLLFSHPFSSIVRNRELGMETAQSNLTRSVVTTHKHTER